MTAATIVTTASDVLFGVDEVEPGPEGGGAMRGSMRLGPHHAGPDGRPAVGALGVLADEVLGYSIIASLPPPAWTVSTEIWLDLLRPLPTSGLLTAEAATVSTGSFAVGRIRDRRGQVLVECRERGRRITDLPDLDACTAAPRTDPGPDCASLAELVGLTLEEVPRLEVTPPLENPRRMLHGGISLAAAEVVATASRVAAGSSLATTSVHVVHTRAAPYGSVVEFDARTVHAGTSLWITEVTGRVGGKVCVAARVSAQ